MSELVFDDQKPVLGSIRLLGTDRLLRSRLFDISAGDLDIVFDRWRASAGAQARLALIARAPRLLSLGGDRYEKATHSQDDKRRASHRSLRIAGDISGMVELNMTAF